jgi:transcriptional regulator with XRE-family HTH domain
MESFSAKLDLVLKALSLSRGQLALDLGVDKSAVGRWVTGAVVPSGHNLARLTGLIAQRMPGFTALDWDRPLADLAARLGADPATVAGAPAGASPVEGLPLAIFDLIRAGTELRGGAYEGFFRSTRPYVLQPGRFVHDHGMIRRHANGLLELRMGAGGTLAEGWMLPLHNQLFAIVADVTSGALLFGVFNGVAAPRVDTVDGLVLGPALDPGRTPTAYAMVFERVADLSGDPARDDATFASLMAKNPLAPEGSVPKALADHLLRDVGPAAFAAGGDLLLRMPLTRSLARGAPYAEPTAG